MATPLPPLTASLDAQLPVLLLPVSVQVKFVRTPANAATGAAEKFELLVRCYPDQLSISTHQVALTAPERAAGLDYWGYAQPHDLGRWRALVARFGVPRASWILRQTSPLGQQLGLAPAQAVVDSNWTEPAQALGLPDYFSVLLYTAADATKADEVAALKATAAGQLLFGSPTSAAYAASRVPQPTTEFLVLRHTATGKAIGSQSLSVSLHPDPNAATATGVLGVDEHNKWTVDFAEAERVGMAMRIAFDSEAEYLAGFARLVVVGVRQTTPDSQPAFERLLSDHYYTDGLQLVAQGTPTNNTDAVAAGYSSRERADADAAFGLLTQSATFDAATPWATRPDGQHLAATLGLSSALAPASGAPAALPTVPALAGADGQDLTEAKLLNRALWPATYGYFLEEMLAPLLSADALDWTRRLVEDYVLARGAAPTLRVGAQPYGLLATTQFSAWQVDDQQAGHAYATTLQQVLRQLDAAWTERLNPQKDLYPASVAAGAAKAGFVPPPAASDNLLTTLALDATSTEYYQRYLIGPLLAEALGNYAKQTPDADNKLSSIWADAASGIGVYDPAQSPVYKDFADLLDPAGTLLPRPLAAPPIFGQAFQSAFTKLADAFADEPGARRQEGVLLDDQPLSETDPLAPFGGLKGASVDFTPPVNYVDWLATASFDEVRLEDFTRIVDGANSGNFHAPKSLLYSLLRQAVLLRYWAAAKKFFATNTTAAGTKPGAAQQLESETFNILTTGDKPRWNWLYEQVNKPGGGTQALHDYLRAHDAKLTDYLSAVGRLATLPTARLERLLAEHLDLGSYRLDAWRLAPVTERLHQLRDASATAQGSHFGAFGWLEDGRPTDHSTVGADGVHADPDNLGYLHAPSLTHGTAAAILRQGYKSRQHTADPLDPAADRMAVDVSSRRVRAALELLEGLRGGQSLGALLGQRFERALAQQPGTANGRPYAYYISQFRQAFPLAEEHALTADQFASATTAPPVGTAVEQAQRQVTDGAALLRTAAQRKTYPYGVSLAPAATSDFGLFITAQLAQLTDELDALGDLAVSEGIYQAARGNADRAGAVLESVAQGQFPVQPDIVHPNARGFALTQRVLVQLPTAALTGWPLDRTPRALAAPRLNAWLGQFLPDPQGLSFALGYRAANGDWLTQDAATLFQAGLQPIDLLYLLDENALQADSALDRLLGYAYGQLPRVLPSNSSSVPADARLTLDYAGGTAPAALARLLPLLARLRQLLSGARPALAPDLQAPGRVADANEDTGAQLTDLSQRLRAGQATLAGLATATTTAAADFYTAALHGVAEALPGLAPGAPAEALAAAGNRLRLALQARLAGQPAATTAAATVAAELDRAQAVFGPAFRPDVEFTLGNAGAGATDPANVAQAAYAAATDPAAVALLLRYHDQPAEARTPSLAMQEWLHGLAAVREPLNHLDKVLLINSVLDPAAELAPLPLLPAQLVSQPGVAPDNKGDYWLGLPWDTKQTDDQGNPKPPYAPPADALSLVQWLPANYKATDAQCALWLDEWAETLPQPQQPTALTFHFDQPNSEAPQTMLLVVPPTPARLLAGAVWTIDTLAGALNETLDLAKKRTVEPDGLAFTPLATVLPAVVAPVAQQAVTLTLDLGRLNGSARFDEVALQPE